MMRRLLGLLLVATLILPAPALAASQAIEQLKAGVDALLAVLNDESLKNDRAKRREKIWSVVEQRFADTYMTSRVLTQKVWKKLTPAQRREVTKLFSDLIKRSYITKLEAFSGQKITFEKEKELTANRVEVSGHIVHRGEEIPMGYRLIKNDGKWMIYDVIIDQTSQVLHFKRRFKTVIRKKGYDGLIKKLKAETKKAELLEKME